MNTPVKRQGLIVKKVVVALRWDSHVIACLWISTMNQISCKIKKKKKTRFSCFLTILPSLDVNAGLWKRNYHSAVTG